MWISLIALLLTLSKNCVPALLILHTMHLATALLAKIAWRPTACQGEASTASAANVSPVPRPEPVEQTRAGLLGAPQEFAKLLYSEVDLTRLLFLAKGDIAAPIGELVIKTP